MSRDGKIDWDKIDKQNKVNFIDKTDLTKAFEITSICSDKGKAY